MRLFLSVKIYLFVRTSTIQTFLKKISIKNEFIRKLDCSNINKTIPVRTLKTTYRNYSCISQKFILCRFLQINVNIETKQELIVRV